MVFSPFCFWPKSQPRLEALQVEPRAPTVHPLPGTDTEDNQNIPSNQINQFPIFIFCDVPVSFLLREWLVLPAKPIHQWEDWLDVGKENLPRAGISLAAALSEMEGSEGMISCCQSLLIVLKSGKKKQGKFKIGLICLGKRSNESKWLCLGRTRFDNPCIFSSPRTVKIKAFPSASFSAQSAPFEEQNENFSNGG